MAKDVHRAAFSRASISALVSAFLLAAFAPVAHAKTVTYYYVDPAGNVLATSDSSGVIVNSSEYRPYGKPEGGSPTNDVGYAGHVFDDDTGMSYMQARYYDPETGRFISVDPNFTRPGATATFSRYAYGANNPFFYIDSDGREPLPIYQALEDMKFWKGWGKDARTLAVSSAVATGHELSRRSSVEGTAIAAWGGGVTASKGLLHADDTVGIVALGQGVGASVDGKFELLSFQLAKSASSPVRIDSTISLHFIVGASLNLSVDPAGVAKISIGAGLGFEETTNFLSVNGVVNPDQQSPSSDTSERIANPLDDWERGVNRAGLPGSAAPYRDPLERISL